MTSLLVQAALACTVAGLGAAALVLATVRDVRLALRVALEFWLAAGLLRLAGPPSISAIATAAGILVVRQLVFVGLRASPPARTAPLARRGRR